MTVVVRPNQPPVVVVGNPNAPVVTIPSSEINLSIPTGQPGPPGGPGPPGPPGDSAAALGYTHIQGTPSDTWVIVHQLSYYPNLTVVDSAGSEVEGDVVYNSSTTLTVTFSGAFSGVAYLS